MSVHVIISLANPMDDLSICSVQHAWHVTFSRCIKKVANPCSRLQSCSAVPLIWPVTILPAQCWASYDIIDIDL